MGNPKSNGIHYGRFHQNQKLADAIVAGQRTYISDKPCKNGHFEKYTNDYKCVECRRSSQRASWPNRAEKRVFTDDQLLRARDRARKWRKENPEHRRALSANYEKRVRAQTPSWANLRKIIEFYKNKPDGMHVDHVIPIRGQNVSGLHVLENLQYLTPEDNRKKSRKYEVTHE